MSQSPLRLPLPKDIPLETRAVLKKAVVAHRYLAELKGVSSDIPNEAILINTLAMQEAKDSSEVENIITTQDELYRATLFTDHPQNPAAKEVADYAVALKQGFMQIRQHRVIRLADILAIQQTITNHCLPCLPGNTNEAY